MRFLALGVYLIVQLLMLPFVAAAALAFSHYQIRVSRRLGVSQTGIVVLGARLHMHLFGIRRDEASYALAAQLPNFSILAVRVLLFAPLVHKWICGESFFYPKVVPAGDEGIPELMTGRTAHIDRQLHSLGPEVRQVVLLGAGYDARAYGGVLDQQRRIFEVDLRATQQLKLSTLSAAKIPHDHVTFVEVDFSREALFEKLGAAGYDPTLPTCFLWEGVTLYLSEQDVRRSLQDIREHAAAGSLLVCDLYGHRFIRMGDQGILKRTLDATGEHFDFALPFEAGWEEALRSFVVSEGFEVVEANFLGSSDPRGPFMVVAELRVSS